MQGIVSRCVSLQKYADGGIVEIANPTKWIAEDILENIDIDSVTPLHIILSHPYWDGCVLQSEKGFNREMGVFLDLKTETIDDDIEVQSADDDIQLWRDWLNDFPFRDEADFENALAYALTLLIRPGLPVGEVSPMFLVTAPREGVGKTLLIDVLNAAVTGAPTETRTLGDTPAEIKKELGAALRGAPEVLVFDNVSPEKRLDSASLASLVTQVRGAFRVLGASEEQTYENRVTTAYTGSNIELTPELVKRVVRDTACGSRDRREGSQSHCREYPRRNPQKARHVCIVFGADGETLDRKSPRTGSPQTSNARVVCRDFRDTQSQRGRRTFSTEHRRSDAPSRRRVHRTRKRI